MSQSEFAREIGLTVVMMSRYENGHSLPNPSTKRRIEAIVGPVEWPRYPKQHGLI